MCLQVLVIGYHEQAISLFTAIKQRTAFMLVPCHNNVALLEIKINQIYCLLCQASTSEISKYLC